MVNIALAGGASPVALEVLSALLASPTHHAFTILSRAPRANSSPSILQSPRINWQTVDYASNTSLVNALKGVHTVLSFIQVLSDPEQIAQNNLIDACVAAGVKRFAPSEYGSYVTPDSLLNFHGEELHIS